MASFCKQCSERLFDKDYEDFEGMSTVMDTAAGMYTLTICEGCGHIQVDHTGKCVSPDCLDPNHDGNIRPIVERVNKPARW